MKQYHILLKVRRKKKKYINGAEPMVAPSSIGARTLYLSTIMDAFNREIISCVISDEDIKTSNERAKSKRCPSSLRSRKYFIQQKNFKRMPKKTA